jgi:hypothetical protein
VTNLLNAGMGSLRQAILDTPSGGTVDFQPGMTGTISLTTGELAINKDLTISGPGSGVLTVSGNHASRVFDIAATFTVSLSGLTIADGFTTGSGGGIFNAGTLTVTSCTLSGNSAVFGGGGIDNYFGTLTVTGSTLSGNTATAYFGGGGGIWSNGMLTVTNSTLSDNHCGGGGGGIASSDRTLTVTGCTLSGNSGGDGGGISAGGNGSVGILTVTDSILSGNSSDEYGGGISNEYDFGVTLTVTGCTLSGNSAYYGGGGISNDFAAGGTLTVTGCTISGNSAYYGGGILSLYSTLTVTDSTLSGNTARGGGSGIYNDYGRVAVRGIVTIDGDYTQAAGGTLDIRIGGLQAGADYDQLVVTGLATLGGTLQINLVNGYQPQSGDQFQPLLFGSGSGTFAHYTGDVGGFAFLYVYEDGGYLPPGLTLVAN